MLWEQNWNKKSTMIAPIVNWSHSLSHDFSNHPYLTNSKVNNGIFIPSDSPNYSPELWHYGVKGMHWGETTREYEKVGYRNTIPISKPQNEKSVVKEAAAKISKLKSIKRKMQQNRINRSNSRVIRFKNKVLHIHRRPRRTKEQIIDSGTNKINNIIEKTNNRIDNGVDFSDIFDKFMKKKNG